ncbi:helix-turn-helix domain-containing protein [Reyranella sp.]|uniref:helix-turn-helix domain-containing protein n=1 Tax=Reyranella sp. TaxID=1929291 RepID=UPI003BAD39D5
MGYHPVDVHVGSRLRQRRSLLGMSQTALGRAAGVTFQQVQKYERGANRMGASRLFEFATVLDVPVDYFFAELATGTPRRSKPKGGLAPDRATRAQPELDLLSRRETLVLVRAYYEVRPEMLRRKLRTLIEGLANGFPQPRKPRLRNRQAAGVT